MPPRSEHIAKAEENEQVAQSLEAAYPDWAITALFYAAVHWVDAVLDGLGGMSVHPQRHMQRRGEIARRRELAVIEPRYRTLQDVSVGARYECELFYPSDVVYARRTSLEPVKAACRRILGMP